MNDRYRYAFSIFTPTFNRAHLLPRLFNSLKSQTFNDFEWIIVDDGSEDETAHVVESFYSQCDFPINYQFQSHQHKKVAFNLGVKLAKGEFFLAVDSDDELLPSALELLLSTWNTIPQRNQAQYAGVTGLRIDESNNIVGTKFPYTNLDSDYLELFYRYKIKGDKCGFIRTEVLKQFPFPEDIPNHVPEGVVWAKIARLYKTRNINEPLLRAYKGADQITAYKYHLKSLQENAEGHAYWAREILMNELDYFYQRPFWFFKIAANYTRFHLHMKRKDSIYQYPLHSFYPLALVWSLYPIGVGRFIFDYLRNK